MTRDTLAYRACWEHGRLLAMSGEVFVVDACLVCLCFQTPSWFVSHRLHWSRPPTIRRAATDSMHVSKCLPDQLETNPSHSQQVECSPIASVSKYKCRPRLPSERHWREEGGGPVNYLNLQPPGTKRKKCSTQTLEGTIVSESEHSFRFLP